MFASLPMFDFVELTEHTDRLWAAIAHALRNNGADHVPTHLTRPDEPLIVHWRKPGMLLSQACGYPFAVGLRSNAHLIGTFAYDLPHPEDHGFYRSVVVARADDERAVAGEDPMPPSLPRFAGAKVAVNNRDSLSGCVSLGVTLVETAVASIGEVLVTEAHANSLQAVQSSDADLAAIDAISFALLRDVRPQSTDGIAVIGRGPRIPCLPLITSIPDMVEPLQTAVIAAVATLHHESPETLRALRIRGFQPMADADYDATIALGEIAKRFMPVHVD